MMSHMKNSSNYILWKKEAKIVSDLRAKDTVSKLRVRSAESGILAEALENHQEDIQKDCEVQFRHLGSSSSLGASSSTAELRIDSENV
ncbi:unnamed protein product [Mucor hiemalis]